MLRVRLFALSVWVIFKAGMTWISEPESLLTCWVRS